MLSWSPRKTGRSRSKEWFERDFKGMPEAEFVACQPESHPASTPRAKRKISRQKLTHAYYAFVSYVSLGKDHQKSYRGRGDWGIFEPQEFFLRYQLPCMNLFKAIE